ncbi:MAG TPA: glycosyltransferase family 39 protein [Ktedonobacterales bacterium]|jgi:hypothetical protein|nr:glycosyltransferase family 39 protein [Ktedonobacterales bacterium]
MFTWGNPAQRRLSDTGLSHAAARQASGNAIVSTRARSITQTVSKIEGWGVQQLQRAPLPNRVHRLFHWLENHPEWMVALLASALSITAYAWYSVHGLTLAYTDAISHMMIARRVLVSPTPGLAQLGTNWLPLHHMLMLPLIWNYILFHDGFAGAFPSMVAYVVGTTFMFRTGRLLFSSHTAGCVAALAFAVNPNVLYMQATAMTESDMLCASIVAIYYLLRWAYFYYALDLFKASAAVAAGTLVRYDSWALALIAAPLVMYIAWRRGGRVDAESMTILFGILAFAGCMAWFIYNWAIFHDPLAFYNGQYSTRTQQQDIQSHGGLPTYYHAGLSFHVYIQATVDSAGLPISVMAFFGLMYWIFRARLKTWVLPGYLVLVPFVFNWVALVRGISILVTPEINFGVPTYFNVRYGMEMIPSIALFLAFLAIQRRVLLVIALGLVVIFGIGNSTLITRSSTPYVVQDPVYGIGAAGRITGMRAGKWLASHYHGGHVMITYSHDSAIMFDSGLPIDTFVTEVNGYRFVHALADLQASTTWIVISPAGGDNEIEVGLDKRYGQRWQQYYNLRTVISGTQFWALKGTSSP